MIDIDLLILYVFSSTICLTVGLFLLNINSGVSISNQYKRIKRFIAYAAFIELFVDIIIIYGLYNHFTIRAFDKFLIPVCYFFQLQLVTYAMLSLVKPKENNPYPILYAIIPMSVVLIVHITLFINYALTLGFSYSSYLSFIETSYSYILCQITIFLVSLSLVYSVFTVIFESIKFRSKVYECFKGTKILKTRWLANLAIFFAFYFVAASLDFIIDEPIFNIILISINTVIFLSISFVIIDLQGVYTLLLNNWSDNNIELSIPSRVDISLETKLREWLAKENKPYLREGINITIVANEIGVKSRDLSEYINKRYQINFNTWINNYKIEFIKELLSNKNYNDKSLLEISELAGFNDLSAMSKTFKKIVGINPSTFRSSRD